MTHSVISNVQKERDHKSDQEVALKLEYRYGNNLPEEEIRCYERFKGLPGFLELYWSCCEILLTCSSNLLQPAGTG